MFQRKKPNTKSFLFMGLEAPKKWTSLLQKYIRFWSYFAFLCFGKVDYLTSHRFYLFIYVGIDRRARCIFSALRPCRIWRFWSKPETFVGKWSSWHRRTCSYVADRTQVLPNWSFHGIISYLELPKTHTSQVKLLWKRRCTLIIRFIT